MEKRILYVATSDVHIAIFHLPYLKWLKEQGFVVHLAVENRGNVVFDHIDKIFYLPFPRNPFRREYVSTYKELKRIIETGNYSLVHCHTPLPSVVARLAALKARNRGTKVLYTAHGFHFGKNSSFTHWLIYYTAEYLLSGFTDGIITINKQDYTLIKGRMLHKDTFYIKGIGVETHKFSNLTEVEITGLRKELGYSQNDFILLYIAEYSHTKNHRFIIETLPDLKIRIPNLKVIFAGKGLLMDQMRNLACKLRVSDIISFLGFRHDVHKFACIADVGISASKREGLGLGLAEEMLCSKPVVASINKGHEEMIEHGVNGFFFKKNDKHGFFESIVRLFENPILRKQMGEKAFEKAQQFKIENSLKSMISIYNTYLT